MTNERTYDPNNHRVTPRDEGAPSGIGTSDGAVRIPPRYRGHLLLLRAPGMADPADQEGLREAGAGDFASDKEVAVGFAKWTNVR
jgi:hypothetical protein